MPSFPDGAKAEVAEPRPQHLITAHDLQRTYEASGEVHQAIHNGHNAINPDQWPAIKAELVDEVNKYPHLVALLVELRGTDDADKVWRALIYLRAKAGHVKRRNSAFPAYLHSLRIGDAALRVTDGLITGNRHRSLLAIKGILHDVIEDFDKKRGYENIRMIFGATIARCVLLVTMPEKWLLAKFYPDISALYIPHISLKEMSPEHMSALKKDDFETYSRLGAELKAAFKHRRALGSFKSTYENKGFRFDELIVKGPDNTDSLASDVDDINDGAVVLFKSDKIRATLPDTEAEGKAYISTEQAMHHMKNRIEYHQNAIMAQFNRLVARAESTEQAKLVKEVRDRIDDEFWNTVDKFNLLVIHAGGVGLRASTVVSKTALRA